MKSDSKASKAKSKEVKSKGDKEKRTKLELLRGSWMLVMIKLTNYETATYENLRITMGLSSSAWTQLMK